MKILILIQFLPKITNLDQKSWKFMIFMIFYEKSKKIMKIMPRRSASPTEDFASQRVADWRFRVAARRRLKISRRSASPTDDFASPTDDFVSQRVARLTISRRATDDRQSTDDFASQRVADWRFRVADWRFRVAANRATDDFVAIARRATDDLFQIDSNFKFESIWNDILITNECKSHNSKEIFVSLNQKWM